MSELREGRVVKRSSNANSHEPAKRQRAPYALRACDACRRRKGKCDGAQPCGHCAGRGQGCSYSTSLASDEWWLATVASDAAGDRGEQTQNLRASKRASSITSSSNTNTQEAIMEMMSNLQGQLDSLASHVRSSGQNSNAQPANPNNSGSVGEGSTPSNETEATLSEHLVRRASQHFYGPTSPEYSLNVAQIKLRQMTSSGTPLQKQHLQLASIDDDAVSDHEDSNEIDQSTPAGSPQNRDRGEKTRLMRFRSLMSLQEAVRLLFVYQEVVGEFHPIIDIDKIMARLRSCYADVDPALWDCSPGRSGSTSGDEEILILNLALAIALRAEAKSSTHEMEGQIRESFEDSVNSRIAAPVTSLNAVTITLLKGFYDFFYDMIRSSWRMCGIAGRMLMELGLHNGDQSKFVVDSESQRTDVSTLVCSIVILDRQWSASTGLPKNFQDSHFDPLPKASIKNPYLKAMLSFILISDKFNEPISQAAKGEKYDDDDAFEVMNFQIEQWRKKSVGAHCLTQVDSWATDPSTRPPSWAILLTLRAMSIRSLLLKPSFFSQHDTEASKKCLRPAIEIASTMINALYTLDTNTDIYRKQHPYYQHLLASASALAFLIVASMEQNRHTRGVSLPPDLIETLNRTTEMAITLAANYAKTSRASRRLLKKLSEMRGSLIGLGITQTPATLSQEKRQPQRREQEASLANTSRAVQRKALPQQQALVPSGSFEFRAEFSQPFDVSTTAPAFTGSMAPLSDFDLQSGGWAESLWFHWPLGADSSMFPEPGT